MLQYEQNLQQSGCTLIAGIDEAGRGPLAGPVVVAGVIMPLDDIIEGIRRRCGWIAPITVYPGEMEQEAMAHSVLKVLHGEAEAIHYSGRPVWEGFNFNK